MIPVGTCEAAAMDEAFMGSGGLLAGALARSECEKLLADLEARAAAEPAELDSVDRALGRADRVGDALLGPASGHE